MQLTLEELKLYLRCDGEDEDTLLSSLLLTSDEVIKNMTHKNADNTSNTFKLAQMMLCGHWYENRNTVIIGSISKNLEFALNDLLTLISYTTDDEV